MRRVLTFLLAAVVLTIPLAALTPASPTQKRIPNLSEGTPEYGPHWMLPNPDVYPTVPFVQPAGWTGTPRATRAGGSAVLATGPQDVVIILIDFPNRASSVTSSAIQTEFNDATPGAVSAHNFYAENSYGQLDLQGTVTNWVQAPQNMQYYGADSSTSSYDDANGPIYTLVVDAVQRVDASVNFADPRFDRDNDGVVDHVVVVHAGGAQEESGSANDIWSHRWSVVDANPGAPGNNPLMADGKQIYGYIMVSEESPVGVYVHELGHDFGLPDLYDTDGSSPEGGVGKWDVMATGSWNALTGGQRGTMPAHFSAWSKMQLGWLQPITVPAAAPSQAIDQMETRTASNGIPQPFKLPIRQVTSSAEEYFLVENRAQTGFDRGLPGDGLLIWHIDESEIGNSDDTHRLVDLEEADGNEQPTQGGDAWPNANVNPDGFGPDSTPTSNSYLNQRTGWRVRNISPPGATMTADLSREVLDDLVILGIQRPWGVASGTSVPIRVEVGNRGARSQTNVAVNLSVYRDTYPGPVLCCAAQTVGSLALGATANLTFTVNAAAEGRHILEASVPLAADEIPENNFAFAHFNAFADTASYYFLDDVEPTAESGWWTNGSGTDPVIWEVVQDGNATASHSASHAWRLQRQVGICLLCPQYHSLTTPNVTVPAGPVYLYVWQRFDLRGRVEVNGTVETDTAFISLSIDGGSTWKVLGTLLTGAQTNWALASDNQSNPQRVGFNLTSEFPGAGPWNVQVRFSASSNAFTDEGGWWIDDVAVTRTPLSGAIAARAVAPSVTVNRGGVAYFRLKVSNVGDVEDVFRFALAPPTGWTAAIGQNQSQMYSVDSFRIPLRPDVEATLFLGFATPADAPCGRTNDVAVTAVSATDPSVATTFGTTTAISDPFGLCGLERYVFAFIVVLAVVIVIAVVIDAMKKQKGVYRRW